MTESTYFIRHILPTNASIVSNKQLLTANDKPAWGFKFDDTELGLHDSEEGFLTDIIVKAKSLDEAIKKAKALSENLAAYITLISGDVMDSAIFLFGYDFSENKDRREFQQHIILPISDKRIFNPLKTEEFQEIFTAMSSTIHNPEIIRAIMLLRAAMQDNLNEIIKFTSLWQGLEVLNEKLMDEYLVTEKEKWNSCQKCQEKTSPKMSVGIQKLFNNKSEFNRITLNYETNLTLKTRTN